MKEYTTRSARHRATKRFTALLMVVFIIAACSQNISTSTADGSGVPSQTSVDFEALDTMPSGKFLFVVASENVSCGVGCNCPAVEGIMDSFRYKDGTLYLLRVNLGSQKSWSEILASKNAIGFYVYHSVSAAKRSFIISFPYETQHADFTVNGVDKNGAISVRAGRGDTILQPGQNLKTENVRLSGLCSMTYTNSIKNHGLLDNSQVAIIPEGEYYP